MAHSNQLSSSQDVTSRLEQMLCRNQELLTVFPMDELKQERLHRKLRTAHNFPGFTALAKDLLTSSQLCRELGIHGRVGVITTADGRSFVIVKGHPGTPTVLTGTRHLPNNPKIVRLAIGRVGLAASVAEGTMLTIVLYVGIDVLEFILNEQATLAMLSANLTTDLMKVGISFVAGATLGLIAGAFTTVASGPLIVAVFVSTLARAALDFIEDHYGITNNFAKVIDQYAHELAKRHEEMQKSLGRAPHEWERGLIWRMYKIDNPRAF